MRILVTVTELIKTGNWEKVAQSRGIDPGAPVSPAAEIELNPKDYEDAEVAGDILDAIRYPAAHNVNL